MSDFYFTHDLSIYHPVATTPLTDVHSRRLFSFFSFWFLSLILGKWHLYEVGSQTDGPPQRIHQRQQQNGVDWISRLSRTCLAFDLQHPAFMSHLVKASWSQTTLFYCMDMSLFSLYSLEGGEGRDFQGLKVQKKDNTFQGKAYLGRSWSAEKEEEKKGNQEGILSV